MPDCAALKKNAETLFKQENFSECAELYEQIHAECQSVWDEWAVWYYLRALRKLERAKDGIAAGRAFRQVSPDSVRVNGMYSWCLYDVFMKNVNEHDDTNFFKAANEIVRINQQEEYSPYEFIVFRVLDRLHGLNNVSYGQIIHWADKLDPAKLSAEPQPSTGNDTRNESYASPKEKWYGLQTKALFEVGRFEDCIALCTQALDQFQTFHYSNNVWFRWRRALAYLSLDQPELALTDLKQVSKTKKDFFIEHAFARALFALNNNPEALAHAVNGALAPGDIGFKWKLFMLMAQILRALGDLPKAQLHAILAWQARELSNPSKASPELQTLLETLQVDISSVVPVKRLVAQLRPFWEAHIPMPQTEYQGVIERIHANGKSGNITADDGKRYFFGVRNFKGASNKMQPGQRVGFNLEEVVNNKTNAAEWHAVDIVPL